MEHKKDEKLIRERNISFQHIVDALENGGFIKSEQNKKPYEHQVMLFILIDSYVHLVPCVLDKNKVFLKTIIPSSKHTKLYKNNKL